VVSDDKKQTNRHEHNLEHEHDHGHDHGHANFLELYGEGGSNQVARSFIIAHVLELGIAMHSVLIGLTLGVTTDYSSLTALFIALCFHQFFEGFALGSSIAGAKISNKIHIGIMVAIFTLTTPIGIMSGILVESSYDGESQEAQYTEGTLDSISGGILIYMALVDIIAEDF
jgi:zinc transporter 1/2/3